MKKALFAGLLLLTAAIPASGQIAISQLPSASLPLAGTEAMVGVQNGTTVQMPSGAIGVQGPTSATSGHFATFNGTTGRLIQDGGGFGTTAGTVTQGNDARLGAGAVNGAIKSNGSNIFSQAATTNLSDVSSGSWTPVDASGASLTFSGVSANYTKIGNMVFAYFNLTYPSTADGSYSLIGGLPASLPAVNYARQGFLSFHSVSTATGILPVISSSTFQVLNGTARATNANLSGANIVGMAIYPVQ